VHLVGFIIRIYHDARSPERQILRSCFLGMNVALTATYSVTNTKNLKVTVAHVTKNLAHCITP